MEAAKEKTELFTCGEYVMRNVKPLHGIGHSEHVFEFKESEKGSVEKFVKAVNNHDLLVEALKELNEFCDNAFGNAVIGRPVRNKAKKLLEALSKAE